MAYSVREEALIKREGSCYRFFSDVQCYSILFEHFVSRGELKEI